MSHMEREERRRRFRTVFPLLAATAFLSTIIGYTFPQWPFWLLGSFMIMLLGAWIFGIWYVRK